ncbi:LEA type 2 family protein [Rhodohalobacter sp. 8-1]|uniref:LEA type 2 family protein n=1 Tax=Rhodohalobacter sp. 8-1 TaxID=3131972 RepID=UPI0030EF54EF
MKKHLLPAFLMLMLTILSSCAALRDAADIQEPTVRFSNMSIQTINFDGVTLLFDFDVTNPNRLDVSANRYNYEFFINGQSFISGTQEERLEIGRESTSTVQVPVSMTFSNLYESFRSVLRQDSVSYRMDTAVSFSLPVIGSRTVPVQAEGVLPIPKIPRIQFGDFEMKRLSFSGAEIELSFRVSNPNAFGITLAGADYALQVNGKEWLDTRLGESIRVDGSDTREITIPVQLSASQMGSALVEMMGGRKEFEYRLTGQARVSADLEGFTEEQSVPFDLEGIFNIDDF